MSATLPPGDDLLELALDLRAWVQVHQSDHARLEPASAEPVISPAAAIRPVASPAAAIRPAASPPPPSPASKPREQAQPLPVASSLSELGRQLSDCTRCALHEHRNQVVFGTGSAAAEIVFVGEGPGRNEDLQGEPFVGDAGLLLNRIIENVLGLQRSDVYICNVVKCRPPGNRDPAPDEVSTCSPFLWQQLDFLKPVLVVALGRFAAQTLLQTSDGIGQLRGRVHPFRDAALLATYHPAYLLRNPADKRKVFDDMKLARRVFQERTGRDLPEPPQAGARS